MQAENANSFGAPVMDIFMELNSSPVWYSASNGSQTLTSVGSYVAGAFSKSLSPIGDKIIMLTRNNVTPAKLETSSINGQALNKSSIPIVQTNTRIIFMQGRGGNQQLDGILDFCGAGVTILDTLQTGCQVSVRIDTLTNTIVKQEDSLQVPVGIEVKRNGKTVRSYSPSPWSSISAQSIYGIQPGDVLLFSLGDKKENMWWLKEVSVTGEEIKNIQTDEADALVPAKESLSQNYPNPFNPSTIIHYEIPNDGLVTLKVYDELGREVKTLVNQYQNKGKYDVNFDASNLASGIYFYRLQSGNFISTKKMLLLK